VPYPTELYLTSHDSSRCKLIFKWKKITYSKCLLNIEHRLMKHMTNTRWGMMTKKEFFVQVRSWSYLYAYTDFTSCSYTESHETIMNSFTWNLQAIACDRISVAMRLIAATCFLYIAWEIFVKPIFPTILHNIYVSAYSLLDKESLKRLLLINWHGHPNWLASFSIG